MGPKVPATPKIDLNSPGAKHQVAGLIESLDLCHLNLASETQAYKSCTAQVAPPLAFWQKPLGIVLIGIAAAGLGAFAHGYIEANTNH